MGLEYYLIKPRTKEMFYLGKYDWYLLEGISRYQCMTAEYENYKDVLKDLIFADCYDADDTMEYMCTLASEIFDFVEGEKVQIVSDCDDDIFWSRYKEVKDICNIARSIYGDC
jgi:hypothetical protein